MKRFLLCLSLLSIGVTGMLAQSECLPQNYSIILGGGVSLPHVEGNRNDFFSKNGNRVGYDLMTEGRYYITPLFAVGLQYDYLRMARLPDKAHLHCIRPNITYRPLWSNGNQGLFLSFGIGLPSLYAGTGIQRQDTARETGTTPILLLVQARGTQEYHE